MRPSILLRSFSSKLTTRLSPSAAVAPWPPVLTAFDRWLTFELEDLFLSSSHDRCTSAAWLTRVVDIAVKSQKKAAALAGACRLGLDAYDRKAVDDCLDDVIELLDACNGARERMQSIETYVDALSIALHQLGGCGGGGDNWHEPGVAAHRRARAALSSCESMERRCADLDKCGSNLRKLSEKLASSCSPQPPSQASRSMTASSSVTELHEALSGSRAVALLAVSMLQTAISFKSRRGLPPPATAAAHPTLKIGSWGSSLHELHKRVKEEFEKQKREGLVVLDELQAMTAASRSLREAMTGRRDQRELKMASDLARRRCTEVEEKVKPLKGKMDELYKDLIGVRVSLLGMHTRTN